MFPLKIAFIVDVFPRLSETFILNQIAGLIDRGHHVDIIAKNKEKIPQINPDVIKYDLLRHTIYLNEIDRTIPGNKIKRIHGAIFLLIKNFKKRPESILKSLNPVKHKRKALSLKNFYRLIPFLDSRPYDIIHCHFGPSGNLALYLKDIGAIEGKVITTFYGYDISSYIKQNGGQAYTSLFQRGDLFAAICEDMKNRLIRLGCNREKIIIHRLGVDMDRFGCQYREFDNERTVNLLSVGRFVEKKGFEFSIRAVANIIRKYPRISYKIIGDGRLKDEIDNLIEELNVRPFVELLGWRTQDEVEKLMAESDIFIAPSVTGTDGDREGTPTVLIEASARCMPIVSTIHAGIPEVVQDGKSGFLVPEKDVTALTEKIQYLVENPQEWTNMGLAGRKHVIKNYDKNVLNKQLIETYKQIIGVEAST